MLTHIFYFLFAKPRTRRIVPCKRQLSLTSVHTDDVPVEDDILVTPEEPLCTETYPDGIRLDITRESEANLLLIRRRRAILADLKLKVVA